MATLDIIINGTSEGIAKALQAAIANLTSFDATAQRATASASQSLAGVGAAAERAARSFSLLNNAPFSFGVNATRAATQVNSALAQTTTIAQISIRSFTLLNNAPFTFGVNASRAATQAVNGLRAAEQAATSAQRTFTLLNRTPFTFGANLARANNQIGSAVPVINSAGAAAARSNVNFQNWGRVIQDLPFGFIGIQNNLTQLIPSVGAFGLAFSVLVSAITFAQTGLSNWTRGLDGNKKATKDATGANYDFADSLDAVASAQLKGARNSQQEIVELKALYAVSQNTAASSKQRKDAVDALQSQYPDYFKNIKDEIILAGGAADKYRQLTTSILATARARAAEEIIAKNTGRQLENDIKAKQFQLDIDKKRAQLSKQIGKIRKDQEGGGLAAGSAGVGSSAGQGLADIRARGEKALNDLISKRNNLNTDSQILQKQNLALEKDIGKQVVVNNANLANGSDAGATKTAAKVKSLADVLKDLNNDLNKVDVNFKQSFDEKNISRIQAYQKAINDLTDLGYKKQSLAIQELIKQQMRLTDINGFVPLSGSVNQALPAQRNSLGQKGLDGIDVTDPGLQAYKNIEKFNAKEAKQRAKINDSFNRELSNGVTRFGEDFFATITTLNQQTDRSFSATFSGLAKSFQTSLNDVLINGLMKKLGTILEKTFSELTKQQQGLIAGASFIGGAISGITNKTSTVGQAAGGALSGTASGAVLGASIGTIGGPIGVGAGLTAGAILGGITGIIGGIFGSSKAKKQEELQKKQLAEAEKQTKLQEHQNALAYTSSIIGRMTTNGVVTGVEVNEFGQLTTKISGQDIQITLDRANKSRQRGT